VIAVRISLSGSLTPVIVGGEYDLRQSDPDILLPLKIRDLIGSDYSDEASAQDLIEHYESFWSYTPSISLLFIASSKSHVKPMVVGARVF